MAADGTRRYDRLGRVEPRQFPITTLLGAVPGATARMRRVPGTAVVEERVQEGAEDVLLSCPCGRQPAIPRRDLTKCPGCERWYFWAIQVWVLYGEMEPPAIPAGEAPDDGTAA